MVHKIVSAPWVKPMPAKVYFGGKKKIRRTSAMLPAQKMPVHGRIGR